MIMVLGWHQSFPMAPGGAEEMDPTEARQRLLGLRARLVEQDEALRESLGISLEEESGEESSDQHLRRSRRVRTDSAIAAGNPSRRVACR